MCSATQSIGAMVAGGPKTADGLLTLVYEELRRLAAHRMANEAPGQTLQATALVHEAWLRLMTDENRRFQDRSHFFAAAAEAMRRILIDRARRRRAVRHGGDYQRVDMEDALLVSTADDEQLLALDDALQKLTLKHPAQAKVVKLRYFVGLTNQEIAEMLGVSLSTVGNYWLFAKAWLFKEIKSA